MRVIAQIQHPQMLISIFNMNDKFIVKFEAGPMEQTFKFTKEQFQSPEQIKAALDEAFLNKVLDRFKEMFGDMKTVTPK